MSVEATSHDVVDEALERLAGTAPEYAGGLSNHGPMVVDALVAMGRGDAVLSFVDRYRRALDPAPETTDALPADGWDGALGHHEQYAAFDALFERELADAAVDEVLARWVPRLSPGAIGAAGHGVIRTAHARRSLAATDTPQRRRELAAGLAYWAASYTELPGPPALVGSGSVAQQVSGLPHLDEGDDGGGLITERVARLHEVFEPFDATVAGLASPVDPLLELDALAAAGAAAYLRNASRGFIHGIALIHAVTAPMAVELLLGDLAVADRASTFAYAWQAAAALHTCYAEDRRPFDAADLADDLPYPEDLITAAVDCGDEHAIKFTEAALRAYQRSGEPVLLVAASDASRRLR